ncbi:MAG: ComF family protein [Planctomycetota bacterium]|jgi:ComF family protein
MPGEPPLERLREYLDRCAEAWLGYELPPARRALELSGFGPDDPERYCPRCGDSVGEGERTATGCGACRGRPAPADGVIRLGRYAPPLRDWILAVKYRRWAEMGTLLGRRLGRAVRDAGESDVVVVPAPMPSLRRLHRGIDHARVIAAAVADELGAPRIDALARRTGPSQAARSSSQRRRRGGAGMTVRRGARGRAVAGRTVILVDDVRTTGATARAAAGHLRRLGADRVVLAVLAVRDDPGRGDARP